MIVPVETGRDLIAFVNVPWALHDGAPGWTPDYRRSQIKFLDPRTGPFYTFGTAQAFLAMEGRRPRGRIMAHVNHAYNAHHGTSVGGFGFLDAPPDPAVVAPLLETAEEWLRRQGVVEVWGPLDFCLYDRVGLQLDGFDRPLPMGAAYHPPGLAQILEQAGYRTKRDATVFTMPTPQEPPPFVARIVAQRRVPGITVRPIHMERRQDEARIIGRVIDRAFAGNWLYFPFPDALIQFHADELASVAKPANILIAEVDGEPAGVMAVVPDLGPVLRATRGNLIPWGIRGVWRQTRAPREMLVVVLAVVPEFHMLGVVAHLIDVMVRSGTQRYCRRVCTTWVDDGNLPMANAFRRWNASPYARHRIFAKPL